MFPFSVWFSDIQCLFFVALFSCNSKHFVVYGLLGSIEKMTKRQQQ